MEEKTIRCDKDTEKGIRETAKLITLTKMDYENLIIERLTKHEWNAKTETEILKFSGGIIALKTVLDILKNMNILNGTEL